MKKIFLLFFTALTSAPLLAQTDTIFVADKRLLTKEIRSCSRQYLVYRQRPGGGAKKQLSVWERNVEVKNRRVYVSQQWFGADTVTRQLFSICDANDFRPVYHYVKNYRQEVEAFRFAGNQTLGADSVKNNTKKDFLNTWQTPVFNWELDMETFALLPFKKGKKFVIPFYHPGSSTGPAFYTYEVIGEEKITLNNEKPVACWQLKIQYSEANYAIFWIDKKGREVLKMKEFFNGWERYKIKIATLPLA